MKTNDEGIRKWLEEKGVDKRFIRDERERLNESGLLFPFHSMVKYMKPVVDAMRKADLI